MLSLIINGWCFLYIFISSVLVYSYTDLSRFVMIDCPSYGAYPIIRLFVNINSYHASKGGVGRLSMSVNNMLDHLWIHTRFTKLFIIIPDTEFNNKLSRKFIHHSFICMIYSLPKTSCKVSHNLSWATISGPLPYKVGSSNVEFFRRRDL